MRPRLNTASASGERLGEHAARLGRGEVALGDDGDEGQLVAERQRRVHGRPPTVVAATSPPNTLAAAFSGCPSWAAATAKGSSAPAAAAAAAASAAEEPSPRATGICERTVTAKRSWPRTSATTRAARCDASSKRPDPSPSLCTRSDGAGSTSTLT